MTTAFASRERAATQQINAPVNALVNSLRPVSVVAATVPELARLKAEKVALLQAILNETQKILGLEAAGATQADKAKEAAEKAKAWSMVAAVFAVVVAVVLVVIAIVVSAFTFGASGALIVGAVAAASAIIGATTGALTSAALLGATISSFMNAATTGGHPLAASFADAVTRISSAGQRFVSSRRKDRQDADTSLTDIQIALLQIRGLTIEAARLPGPCFGDPEAIFQAGRDMGPLLSNLEQILQTMRLLHDEDAQTAIRTIRLAKARVTSLRPLPVVLKTRL